MISIDCYCSYAGSHIYLSNIVLARKWYNRRYSHGKTEKILTLYWYSYHLLPQNIGSWMIFMKEIVCMNKKTIEITNKNIWQTRRFLWKLILVIVAQIQRKKENLMQAWKLSTWEYILLLKDSNLTFSFSFGFSSMYWAFDFLFLNVYTMACIRK